MSRNAMRRFLISLCFLVAIATTASTAQSYPPGPVRLVVPFPPGGSSDLVGRLVAHNLSFHLGQQVIVENRAGANGDIAGEIVARATPDGLTLLLGYDAMFTVNPFAFPKRTFAPMMDLIPISSVVATPMVLFANPELIPVGDLKEFVVFAKTANPPLLYGSAGVGSTHHLAMELFKKSADFRAVHVPFRGGAQASNGLLAGQISVMVGGAGASAPLVEAGKLRALANTSSIKLPIFPHLPSIGQFYPGYDVSGWFGVFAPAKTPNDIVETLRAAISAAIAEPEFVSRMEHSASGLAYATTADQFIRRINGDRDRIGPVVRNLDLKVN